MIFRKYLFTSLLMILLSIGSMTLYAQPGGGPPGPGGTAPCDTPPCGPPDNPGPPGRVPIGGIEILIAAGAALGAGRLAVRKSATKPE